MIVLFEHQQKVLDISKDKRAYAWFLETGTGKTILFLENVRYLYESKKIRAVIITAPKTVLKPVWIKTLGDFYSGNLDYYVFQWIGGLSEYQEKIFYELIKQPQKLQKLLFFITNIEAFSHNKIFDYIKSICYHWPTIWGIDESTTVKSPSAKRTKNIISVSHLAEYTRILSGFPILKTPEDLYTQINFLGNNLIPYNSFYAFRNEFCFTKKLDNRVTISTGARNIDKLQQIIKPFSSRIMKKDCIDLPDKIHTCRYIDMTNEQKLHYENFKKQGYTTLLHSEKQVFASTLLTQLEKLHQVANGLVISVEEYIDCNKYQQLIEIVKHEIGDNQFVVWSCYVMNIYQIQLQLLQSGITCEAVYGEVGINDRNTALGLFRQNKIQSIVANPATAAYGINDMVNASYAIYFNNSFHLEHRIQSEDRLHRIGQVNKVTYIDLITDNTIEDKILDALEKKHNIGALALGDEWKDWFS